MLQLFFSRLARGRVQPTNLLPTGVVITSNKHHRRLLPTESFGPPTRSLLGYRTEPSFLSNQPFGFKGAGFVRCAIHSSGITGKGIFILSPSVVTGGRRCWERLGRETGL